MNSANRVAALAGAILLLAAPEANARTWVIPHVLEQQGNVVTATNTFDYALHLALAGPLVNPGSGDSATVDVYWYDDNGDPVQSLGLVDVCNPCSFDLHSRRIHDTADLDQLMVDAGGFDNPFETGFLVIDAQGDADQVVVQGQLVYVKTGPSDVQFLEIDPVEPDPSAGVYLMPFLVEQQGSILVSQFTFDTFLYFAYAGGLPGSPSPGAGATVDVYLFDLQTGAPLAGNTDVVCNPCTVNLDPLNRKETLEVENEIINAGGYVVPVHQFCALLVLSGEVDHVGIEGYTINVRTGPADLVITEFNPKLALAPHVVSVGDAVPSPAARLSAFPNPFGSLATLSFDLSSPTSIQANIYDAGGRQVRTLFEGSRAAGPQRLLWDGRDDNGNTVGPGVYFVRIESQEQVLTTRVVRIP